MLGLLTDNVLWNGIRKEFKRAFENLTLSWHVVRTSVFDSEERQIGFVGVVGILAGKLIEIEDNMFCHSVKFLGEPKDPTGKKMISRSRRVYCILHLLILQPLSANDVEILISVIDSVRRYFVVKTVDPHEQRDAIKVSPGEFVLTGFAFRIVRGDDASIRDVFCTGLLSLDQVVQNRQVMFLVVNSGFFIILTVGAFLLLFESCEGLCECGSMVGHGDEDVLIVKNSKRAKAKR